MNKESNFIIITKVQGDTIANVLKTHLESEGIPVLLQYESLGQDYGITVESIAVEGLGEVRILVPQERAEEARIIIEPIDFNE
ncbi:putative signal transducing protein [Chloroflexota bacterium]